MNISFKDALTFYFKDKSWKNKFPIFAIFIIYISSLPNILSLVTSDYILFDIAWIILNIFFTGYLALLSHNLMNKEEEMFPRFNFQKLLSVGGKSLIILLLYGIPSGIIGYLSITLLHLTHNIGKTICEVVIAIFYGPFPIMVTMSAITAFTENLRFKDSFNLIRLIRISMHAYREYYPLCLFIITYIITAIIFAKGNMNLDALFLGIIGIFLIITFLLYFIIFILFKKKLEFAQELFLFALCIGIIVVYVAPITILNLNHKITVLIFCIITSIIKIPLTLIWIHLLCQAYKFGSSKIKELNNETEVFK